MNEMEKDKKTLTRVLNRIEYLEKCEALLTEIWAYTGGYDRTMPEEVHNKLRNHFEFDDGE